MPVRSFANSAVGVLPTLTMGTAKPAVRSRVAAVTKQSVRVEGLAPVAAGLMMSFGWVMCSTVDTNWRAVLLTLVAVALNLKTRINPVWLVLAGALQSLFGYQFRLNALVAGIGLGLTAVPLIFTSGPFDS